MRTKDLTYGEEYWDTYDNGEGYEDSPVWEDMAHIVKDLFGYDAQGNDISPGKSLIDIGCAHGYLVRHVRRRGIESFGMDISEYAIEEGDSEHLKVWDITDQIYGPFFGWNNFDFVVCLETLEHIRKFETVPALNNLRRLMKPTGGTALLAICVQENEGWESDPTHINIQPRRFWENNLGACGFSIDQEKTEWVQRFKLFRGHHGVFVATATPDMVEPELTQRTPERSGEM